MQTKTMKTVITSCVLAVPLLALNLPAQTTSGWRGANNPTTPFWSVGGNWSPAHVPGVTPAPGEKAAFNNAPQPPCFINSAALSSQFVIGDNNPGNVVILNGGSLSSSNYATIPTSSWNAIGYNNVARLEIRSGGSLISSNHLWVGFNYNSRGNFVMNGGTATVYGMFALGGIGGSGGGLGIAQINGGTLNLAQWNDTSSISPLSQLDIRGGTIIISNDHTASIASFIAGGQLTGYGGVGTVNSTYDTNTLCTVLTASTTPGTGGPYPVTNGLPTVETTFPTNINPNLFVHYWALNPPSTLPNANWTSSLGLVALGDQNTIDVNFRGLAGKQATSTYINVFDQNWQDWNTNGLVDILMCVYGDANILRSAADPNQTRRFRFQEGTTITDGFSSVYSHQIPTNAYNSQWNWMLFTITNNLQTNGIGRLIGTIRTNSTSVSGTNYGGINGGTLRIDTLDTAATGLSIRAIAFGQHGAFGTAPDINQFAAPDGSCPPVLDANLAAIDFNAGYTNRLQVINDPATGQEVVVLNNVGPAGDQRKAVQPTGPFLNFGILSNYLGQACNDDVTMKICVDYYDDPAFAGMGVTFGPYQYSTDSLGDLAYTPNSSLVLLQGTGKWIRQSWSVAGVNLLGVSTAPLTGGPQFVSSGGQVAVSRFYLAALRNVGPLAGQDPLAGCYQDPNICDGVYGNYAEWDLANGITDGLDVGTSSGDQTSVVELAGPANDQRLSVRPDAAPGYYMNFQILTNALGPITQGNVHLAVQVTYYDDPALAGQGFRPEVWTVQQPGLVNQAHLSSAFNIVLQGTGKWRDAYWEIGSISLDGINQHPAAARFSFGSPIHVSRVRYAVTRPCGPTAGQNALRSLTTLTAAADTNSLLRLSWPYRAPQAFLQSTPSLGGSWSAFGGTPAVEGGEQSVLRFGPTINSQFFRLNLTP